LNNRLLRSIVWLILTLAAAAQVAILVLGGILIGTARHSSYKTIDCRERSLSLRPLNPEHAAFTARLIHVGHIVKVDGDWAGGWAIAAVQESYWGLPPWYPRFVLLINGTFWENKTFLINGRREKGILTRLLPIVDVSGCDYFAEQMPDAEIYVRLFRNPPANAQNRITGYVWRLKPMVSSTSRSDVVNYVGGPRQVYWDRFHRSGRHAPFQGAIVNITGSSGSWNFTTDKDGIYVSSDLPAGGYLVRLSNPPANQVSQPERTGRYRVDQTGFARVDLYTYWAGTIEGRINDVTGTPEDAWLDLLCADNDPSRHRVQNEMQANPDGSFQFGGLPIGRYILLLNPYGPKEKAPYPSLYFPSALEREHAEVLEITEKEQHLRDRNFVVKPLAHRTLDVRVTWPDGRASDDALLCVTYEQGGERERLHALSQYGWTDSRGVGIIDLFGEIPARVYAYTVADEKSAPRYRYSTAVELQPSALPHHLELVLRSSDPPK
jgi:hypothetical protein